MSAPSDVGMTRAAVERAGLLPDAAGHFGRFGGRFVPEALIAALDELDAAYRHALADEAFQAEFNRLLRDYAGLPSLLYDATRLSAEVGRADPAQAGGPQPHRRAQGAQRARAGPAHQADGQAARHRRDRRRAARRRQRHRRRAVRPRVRGLHGRGGHPPAGAQRGPDADARRHGHPGDDRLAHAQGRHERGAARLGDQCGQYPLPASVRSPARTRSRPWCATSPAASAWRRGRSAWT